MVSTHFFAANQQMSVCFSAHFISVALLFFFRSLTLSLARAFRVHNDMHMFDSAEKLFAIFRMLTIQFVFVLGAVVRVEYGSGNCDLSEKCLQLDGEKFI